MKFPISVCLITKDEERNIANCLRSIHSFVNEIILLDTGSSDRTIEIAKHYSAHVFEKEWANNFSESRNLALSQANEPYILVMDADEELDPESYQHLEQICSLREGEAGRVPVISPSLDDHVSISRITRAFPNNPRYRYEGRIHEQLLLDKGNVSIRYVNVDVRINHQGYRQEEIIRKNKTERNLDLLLLDYQSNPKDSYTLYQLGKTYQVHQKYEEAEKYLLIALRECKISGAPYPTFYSSLMITMVYVLMKLRKFKEVLLLLQEGVKLFPDYTDLYFMYANTLVQMGDSKYIAMIPELLNHCLKLGEANDHKYESIKGVGSFQAQYNLGIYYELAGKRELAAVFYNQSATYGYKPATLRLRQLGN